MASKARFGRLPRSAPSLTSTIVSLTQEYQRTRDRNLEDAWKNGGEFEGKKATDKMLLDHWKQRRSEVSTDDPMWDYYNNTISQLEFNIEESKMGQKYAEKSVSNGEMAGFYRKWAAKLPKDSEAYRNLMTQAAKFKNAAAARGRGGSAKAAAIAYGKKQQSTYDQYEAPFDQATSIIANMAQQRNILDVKDLQDPDHGWSKLVEGGAEHDPEALANLLIDIMAPANKATRDAMTLALKQADPDFNGVYDEETLARFGNKALTGAHIRQDRAHKFGDTKQENEAKKKGAGYGTSTMVVRATLGNNADKGFVEVNEVNRAALDRVLGDPSKTPSEQRDALDTYQNWLSNEAMPAYMKLFPKGSFDPFSANYNPTANGLVSRMVGTVGALSGNTSGRDAEGRSQNAVQGLTLKDDLFGFSTEKAGNGSDAFKLGEQSHGIRSNMNDVDNGTSMVVRVNAQNNIDPDGTQWAVFDAKDPDVAKQEIVPFAVPGDNFIGGEVRYSATVPVRVAVYSGIDPNTHRPVGGIQNDETTDPNVGSRIEIVGPGGQKYTMWGVMSAGQKVWTVDDPFTEVGKATQFRDDKGNWVVGYIDPNAAKQKGVVGGAPTFNPSAQINQDALKHRILAPDGTFIDSTDGKKWDPTVDKEMGHFSPLSALANSSSEGLKYLNNMGPNAVAKAEREWYSADPSRWTPDMQLMAKNGVPLDQVIEAGAFQLTNDIAVKNRYGVTPEDQQASRTSERAYQVGRAAAAAGMTVDQYLKQVDTDQETIHRNEIGATVTKWAATHPDYMPQLHGEGGWATGETAPLSNKWVAKGWTIGDLLNQPGMSTDQANDLAAIITNGAVGSRLQPGPNTASPFPSVNQPGFGVTYPVKGNTPENPFAPGGNITPRQVNVNAQVPGLIPAVPGVTPRAAPKPIAPPPKYQPPNTHGITVNYPTVNTPAPTDLSHRKPGDPYGLG